MNQQAEGEHLVYAFTKEAVRKMHSASQFLQKLSRRESENVVRSLSTPSEAIVVQSIVPGFDFAADVAWEMEGGEEEFEAWCNGFTSRDHLAGIHGYYCVAPLLGFHFFLAGPGITRLDDNALPFSFYHGDRHLWSEPIDIDNFERYTLVTKFLTKIETNRCFERLEGFHKSGNSITKLGTTIEVTAAVMEQSTINHIVATVSELINDTKCPVSIRCNLL